MSKKIGVTLIIVSTLLIASITIAVSYAYWTTVNVSTKSNKIVSGCFDIELSAEKNIINLENAYPITDSEAETLVPYTFTITNTCDLYASYDVNLEILEGSDLPLRTIATKVNTNEKKILSTLESGEKVESTSVESRKLISGELYPNESTTYELRVWMDESVTLEDNVGNKTLNGKIVVIGSANETDTDIEYKDKVLNGADPVLKENLIPVTIADDGTVTKADLYSEWYDYTDKKWANAVILEDNTQTYNNGDTIPEDNIQSYFVWIPKYKYKLWNVESTTTSENKGKHSIEIVFDTTNTIDEEGVSCATPMTSGGSGNCSNGEYMTHPAFISLDVNGIWVGKFETGYKGATSASSAQVNANDSTKIIVKPNAYSWRSSTVYNMFMSSYNYERELGSHMMKNTEWGAVAILSHSKYGIDREVNINNNSAFKTGYSSLLTIQQGTFPGTYGDGTSYNKAYNTDIGYLASTTGNITGVYDMSGGAFEYMAAYISGKVGSSGFSTTTIATVDYQRYLDVYNASSAIQTYQYRILGDATGEMGPFLTYNDGDGGSRYHNSWYADYSYFVDSSNPWFRRGGNYGDGVLAGQFSFSRGTGTTNSYISFRLVLAD